MDKDQPVKKDLVEAWNRIVGNTYTLKDLVLLLDSVKEDEHLQEFDVVLDRVWQETIINTPSLSKEQIEICKRLFAQVIPQSRDHMSMRSDPVPSLTIVRFRKVWYAAAAALLLGLLIPAVQLFIKPKTEQPVVVVQSIEEVTEVTGRDEIKTIVLPDQTKVTLNVESRLKYPAVFAGERSVELQGEAIFDVTHDSDRPFTVATTEMNVKVLGTVFDVKAYPGDELSMVSVASGKVEVETGRAPSDQDNRITSILLEKDHQLKIDKATGHFEKLTIDAERYLSWTDGSLYFHRTTVSDAVNMLNRYYPKLIFELAEGEYDLVTGKLNPKKGDVRLEPVFRSFGLKYKQNGNKIFLYNENSK